jgi:hypothetical protein
VLNDIHFAPNLTEALSCNFGNCTDMGIKGVGLDSPLKLVTYVLDQAVATLGNIDGVIITGDFVRHNFDYCDGTNAAKCDGVTKEHKYEQIKAIWKNMTDLI